MPNSISKTIQCLAPECEVLLKPGEEDRIVAGHPWVFANEIERVQQGPEPKDPEAPALSQSSRTPEATAPGRRPGTVGAPALGAEPEDPEAPEVRREVRSEARREVRDEVRMEALFRPEPGSVAAVLSSGKRLVGIGFYNPDSQIAVRLLVTKDETISGSFFYDRLQAALERRKMTFPGEEAFRLCFGESDGLPGLIVDKYGDFLVVQVLSAGMERFFGWVQDGLVRLLNPRGILLRNDSYLRKSEGLPLTVKAARGTVPEKVLIEEKGVKSWVPLFKGQKTGLYLDQKQNRYFLEPFFPGRRVLDLYCYVGAFALRAVKSGARLALGVDKSSLAIGIARENSKENNMQERCRFEEGDSVGLLKEIFKGNPQNRPDFIVIDPPNFAPSKASLSNAVPAYVRLLSKGLECLDQGGLLAFATCSRYVTRPLFKEVVEKASRAAKKKVKWLALRGQSDDHPVHPRMRETEYLHFTLLRVESR